MYAGQLRSTLTPTRSEARRFLALVPAIVALFAISAALRWSRRGEAHGLVANIDASYHVLLTIRAFNETPASEHLFLPTVTLGRRLDRDVPWGAAVPGPTGLYNYTSFPPLGFIAPWAFFRISRLAPTLDHLLVFNLAIHLVATLLLALLVWESATALGTAVHIRTALVVLTAATYLFTFEALYSHGIVYWHHSLFQVVWIAQLLAAARVFRAIDAGASIRRRDIMLIAVTSLLGPAIEWTGYLATAVVAARCASIGKETRRADIHWLGVALFACPAVSGALFVMHFGSAIGWHQLTDALRSRGAARSGSAGSISALLRGYRDSFGAMLLLVPVAGMTYVAMVRRRLSAWIVSLTVVATVPLAENLLLSQHATAYHFDRLKLLSTIALVGSIIVASLPRSGQVALSWTWLALFSWNLQDLRRTRVIPALPPLSANIALFGRVHAAARPCTVYAIDVNARGWITLTLGANAYEDVPTVDSAASLVRRRGGCQGIYLRAATNPGEDMHVWRDATVLDEHGEVLETITAQP